MPGDSLVGQLDQLFFAIDGVIRGKSLRLTILQMNGELERLGMVAKTDQWCLTDKAVNFWGGYRPLDHWTATQIAVQIKDIKQAGISADDLEKMMRDSAFIYDGHQLFSPDVVRGLGELDPLWIRNF